MIGSTINRLINWPQLLALLDVKVETTVLPCIIPCPLQPCHGLMRLVYDKNGAGAWAFCHDCKFAGDMVDLASAYWPGLDLALLLKKLVKLGLQLNPERITPHYIDIHNKYHSNKRRDLNNLWIGAQKMFISDESAVLRNIQHKLNLRCDIDNARWEQGPGLFLGGAGRREIETVFQPLSAAHGTKLAIVGHKRVFNGPGWTDVLMLPLHDLPGQIKSCLFIGREARIPEDVVLRQVRYGVTKTYDVTVGTRRFESDCGLALYAAVQFAKERLIVMADPLLALKLQLLHLHDNATPAPLVSVCANHEYHTATYIWETILPEPVFWGAPSAELFRHARALNANICTAGFDNDGPLKALLQTPLSKWFHKIETEAKPWRVVLEQVISELPPHKAEDILINLDLMPNDYNKLLEECSEDLQKRLARFRIDRPAVRTAQWNNNIVREELDHIWYLNTSELCNAALRIEKIIHYAHLRKTFFQGKIFFRDLVVPFYTDKKTLEVSPGSWMRNKLLAAGVGYVRYDVKYDQQLVAISTLLYSPKVVQGYDKPGWYEKDTRFVLPNFCIEKNGDIDTTELVGGKFLHRRNVPAKKITADIDLTAEIFPTGDGSGVFWAVAAAVISNIIAPVFNAPLNGLLLLGSTAHKTGTKTAKALGCCIKRWSDLSIKSGWYTETGWPTILLPPSIDILQKYPAKRRNYTKWLTDNRAKNVVLPVNWEVGKIIAVTGNWHVIDAGVYIPEIQLNDKVGQIVPAFLQYIAKQRFQLPDGYAGTVNQSFTHTVLVWLSQWFSSIGGDPMSVINANKIINIACDSKYKQAMVHGFLDVFCKRCVAGKLTIARAGFLSAEKTYKNTLICFPDKNKIFIPYKSIERIENSNKQLVHIKPPALTILTNSPDLIEQYTYANVPGWLVDEEMWDKRLIRWRDWHRKRLKV